MRRCPVLGERVQFVGSRSIGPCVGTVIKRYPTYRYDDETQRHTNELLPEAQWYIALQTELLPTPWPYKDFTIFTPSVSRLRRAARALIPHWTKSAPPKTHNGSTVWTLYDSISYSHWHSLAPISPEPAPLPSLHRPLDNSSPAGHSPAA